MTNKPFGRLNNYIAMYRRRGALTQPELATLAGLESATTIGRFEDGDNLPSLEVALAMAIALGHPVEELFAGRVEELQEKVALRAQALLEAMSDEPTPENQIKLALLARLAHPDDEHRVIPWEEAA